MHGKLFPCKMLQGQWIINLFTQYYNELPRAIYLGRKPLRNYSNELHNQYLGFDAINNGA